jgi:hypothetical protein
MWDLWWAKWHWDRFFSEYFGFPLSVILYGGEARSLTLRDEDEDVRE